MFFSALYTTKEGAKGSLKGLMGPKLSEGAGRASERPKLLVVYIVHYIIVQLEYAVENLQHNFNGIVNLNHVEYSNISFR